MAASQAAYVGSIPITRSILKMIAYSRKISFWGPFCLIIFLTGCARRGYYTPTDIGTARGGFLAPEIAQKLSWPVEGEIVCSFGSRKEGVRLKGILLRAREGAFVKAAQAGRVGFVDESLRGYGKTVIVEHTSELSTVYAQNAELLVSLGQWVQKGEPIAKVGRDGKGALPLLYFEVRRQARAEDPLNYLKK